MKVIKSSETGLKVTAYVLSSIFAIIMMFPLSYMVGNSLKSDSALYEVPPKIIPASAYSTSVIFDYTNTEISTEAELKEAVLKDAMLTTYAVPYHIKDEGIYDIKIIGLKDGKVIYYSRAHKMEMGLELKYGLYKRTIPNAKSILRDQKYIKAAELLNYQFDLKGLDKKYHKSKIGGSSLEQKVQDLLSKDYPITGKLSGTIKEKNNFLMLENFIYYYKLPTYAYSKDTYISKFSFFMFLFNTTLVISWAILVQVFLCSITAFSLSKLFSKKLANHILIFFLGTMMIPFVSIMVPQMQLFRSLGLYNNYGALLLPHLIPFAYYIFLYKGFFDQIPNELFEAARMDGASELFAYYKICMPLSKPIISLIALNVFLSNWNDFFWAWLVTEDQHLWTLNVALFNLSRDDSISQNFLMGISVISLIPIIIVTIRFAEQIKINIASTGIKG